MGKRFRTDRLDQALLPPPSPRDRLPEGRPARFIADVIEELDLGLIYRSHEGDGRGLAAYQPAMMARLLVRGYCLGVASSRKMERATREDAALRYLSADTHPDHDTIAAFRRRRESRLKKIRAAKAEPEQEARAAVDSQAQVVVAAEITREANDSRQPAPISTLRRDGGSMGRRWSRPTGRRRKTPPSSRRCGTNCGPRPGIRSTRCGRPSWNRSSVRPRSDGSRHSVIEIKICDPAHFGLD